MWYNESLKFIKIAGYEEDILRADAKRCVERRLFYKNKYHPSDALVNNYVEQIMKLIKEQFNTYNNVRNLSDNGNLQYAVEHALNTVLPV